MFSPFLNADPAVSGSRVLCHAGWVDLCPPAGHHVLPAALLQVAGAPAAGAANGTAGIAVHHLGDTGHPV